MDEAKLKLYEAINRYKKESQNKWK
jgi:hypothetical protein